MASRMHMNICMKILTITALQEIINKTKNEQLKQQAQVELTRRLELVIKHLQEAK